MRNRTIKTAAILLFFLGYSLGNVHSFALGPFPGTSGVPPGGGFPAEPTCNQFGCHTGFPLNPDALGKLQITGHPDNYVPGRRYPLTFSISHPAPDRRRWGFQVTGLAARTFLPAGELEVTDSLNTQKIVGGPGGNRQYIEQTFDGTAFGQLGGNSWNFTWVAPSSNMGDVAFYGSGNAANGDGTEGGDRIYSNPRFAPIAITKGQFTFRNEATQAGIATMGGAGGSAIADFNKDGFSDIFLIRAGQPLLFVNNGNGTFSDVTMSSGIISGSARINAAAWGDFDGDGFPDLYLVNAGSDLLFKNNGNGTFSDVSAKAGISDAAVGHAAAWGDLNGDGKQDLYVANEGQNLLYVNRGDGTFSKVDPARAGLEQQAAGWSVALADFDGDGKLDIFVANEGQDFLYKNNGNGTFTDVAVAAGIVTPNAGGRAAAWADYNKDGKLDLFIGNTGEDLLFKNNGNGTFTNVTTAAGLADNAVAAGAAWADYDNDGDLDLFVANVGQDLLYRNNGNGTFNSVATFSGMTDSAMASGASWLDFDKDGNADLLVTNIDTGNFLYKNPGRSGAVSTTSPQVRTVDVSWLGVHSHLDYRTDLVHAPKRFWVDFATTQNWRKKAGIDGLVTLSIGFNR